MGEITENITYKHPLGVSADEDAPEDHVRVQIVLPGLKKKTFKNEIKDGRMEFKPDVRSFTVTVFMKNGSKEDAYRYHIKQLPDDIEPEKCYHKVKDGQVQLFLKKVKSRTWARELDEGGLETFVDEEENMDDSD